MVISSEIKIASSILIGFALVALSLFESGTTLNRNSFLSFLHINSASGAVSVERPDKESRMIYGDIHAPLKLVEFSDLQCPYCSQLHGVLKEIVDQSHGSIQWEYRHFPLPIHPSAQDAARYAECVFRLSGNDAFWKFASVIMNNQIMLSSSFLSDTAEKTGVDASKLQSCIADGSVQSQIDADSHTAEILGGSGTPFTIIVYPDGSTKPVTGALPLAQWKSLLTVKH